MADKILNIKVCSPLKLRSGLAGKYHAVCHYSYNLPLGTIVRTNILSYTEREFYEAKSDRDLFRIYSGTVSSSHNQKLWAKKILEEREFDFDNLQEYRIQWSGEKILEEIQSKSYLIDDEIDFLDRFILIDKSSSLKEFNRIMSIIGLAYLVLLSIMIKRIIAGEEFILFAFLLLVASILFFKNQHYYKKQQKKTEANKQRIREFMKYNSP
jgi:hypothetical protein